VRRRRFNTRCPAKRDVNAGCKRDANADAVTEWRRDKRDYRNDDGARV
jgi:hypothetical protein